MLDPLQQRRSGRWPDIDGDEQRVAWQPVRGKQEPVIVNVQAESGPPPWPVTATVALVREVQRAAGVETRDDGGHPAFRQGIATYSPFRK
jgi:hypothetical protein